MEAAAKTTTPSLLPTPEEARELVPRKDGPVWRLAGDPRGFPTAGYAVLLQVAHPTVGAGVAEYSGFLDDPWGRLMRTLDYVHGTVYGGPDLAREIGARVHGIHKHIKGIKPDGERYNALEPRAFAWVHATLAAAMAHTANTFGTGLKPNETQDFWEEWLRAGRLVGVRLSELPERWSEFDDYFNTMVDEDLEDTETVRLVLSAIANPAAPPIPGVSPRLWGLIARPMATTQRVTTLGLLGPRVRQKLNLSWSRRAQRGFNAYTRLSRASSPLVRGPFANLGPHHVRWRQKQLQRGDVAGHVPARRDTPATAPA